LRHVRRAESLDHDAVAAVALCESASGDDVVTAGSIPSRAVRSFHLLAGPPTWSPIRCHDSAITNEALPHGKIRKTTISGLAARDITVIGPPAGVAAPRESHRQWREHAGRNDQQERDPVHPAVPGARVPPLSIGKSTRNPAKINATPSRASSMTAKPLARLCGS
jgi:hypothetical protein